MIVAALCVAACTGGSGPSAGTPESTGPTSSSTADTPAVTAASTVAPTTIPGFDDGPLADVCDDTIVVQAADFPDVGAGPVYALLGASPTIDAELQTASAPVMRADGTVESTTLEIRSGGPAVGFRSPVAVMAQDDTIHLALTSTAVAVRDRDVLVTTAVAALTDRSGDALLVDPATYPEIRDVTALGESGVEVRHVTDAPVIAYLASIGALADEQLVSGSDGLPAAFVEADGAVAQQGDLTVGPVLLPSLPQWARPVAALAASEAGWRSLDDALLVDAASDRLSDECLGRFVRIVQESISAYIADPSATNAVMSTIGSQFNPLTRLTPELFDAGTQSAIDAGVFDAERDVPSGAIDTDGLDAFLAELAAALDVEPVTADELVDPRYIDPTVTR